MFRVTPLVDVQNQRAALWDVTGTCNLRCRTCYQFDRYDYATKSAYKHDLTHEECVQTLDRLEAAGFTHIHFLGGEPLLRRDLPAIVEDAKSRGFYVSINTNGLPLRRATADRIVSAGTDQIMVSLDGGTEATNDEIRGAGVFAQVVENVRTFRSRYPGTQVGFVFTATTRNVVELPILIDLMLDLDVGYLQIIPVQESGNYVNNKESLVSDTVSSLSPDDLMHQLDVALGSRIDEIRGRILIRADLRLWPIEILNRKYGYVVEPDPTGIRCQGGDRFVVITADGKVGPCSASIDQTYAEPALASGELTITDDHVLAREHLDEAPILKRFRGFHATTKTWSTMRPCDSCEFFRQECEPCPLEHYEQPRVFECEWAEREERRQRAAVENGRIRIGPGFRHAGETVVGSERGPAIELGEFLSSVLRKSCDDGQSLKRVLERDACLEADSEEFDHVVTAFYEFASRGIICVDSIRRDDDD